MNRRVRLELARCHDFPEGSSEHGYDLSLPLSLDGHLDREFWLKHRKGALFRRFWGAVEERGAIRHTHRGWALSFDAGTEADEILFKADQHRFAEGEYVSITERDGVTRTFRVAAVH